MNTYLSSYQPLNGSDSLAGTLRDKDDDDISPDMHPDKLIHVVQESGKKRWNHIEDLDSFFLKVYQYHLHGGIVCMVMEKVLALLQFIYIICVTTFLVTAVNYGILFRNEPPHAGNTTDVFAKTTLWDCVYPSETIHANLKWYMVCLLMFAAIVWILKLGHTIIAIPRFIDIRSFYETALGISDQEITNVTWDDVQQRVIEVQVEQRMCIHKETLSELDIYHRILRFDNYLVAMINKDLLPLKINVPFLGSCLFLTRGLRFNLEFILFWGPWAPFKNNWHLRDEYKRSDRRHDLAQQLRKRLLYLGIANMLLSPVILIWQILYAVFCLADILRREPGLLGMRRWSHYGELYLRHFNELEHELQARLNRGYKAASLYMNSFSSRSGSIIVKHVTFVCASIFAVFTLLGIIDEDVFMVQHVLSILTFCGAAVFLSKMFIPDEYQVWCPELLLRRVLAEVHYAPDVWRGRAHTSLVRGAFSQLFQYRIVHMLEELVSPIVTPIILYFKLSRKALDIVDFYRNFTVEVVGVGDVCSFAQMDIRRHGSQTWHPEASDIGYHHQDVEDVASKTDGGKTELSLLHFTLTNPNWEPPQESSSFLTALKTQAQKDYAALSTVHEENPLTVTAESFTDSPGLGAIGNSMLRSPWIGARHSSLGQSVRNLGNNPLNSSQHCASQVGVLGTLAASYPSDQGESSLGLPINPAHAAQPADLAAVDVSFSTLYLHELHQRHRARTRYVDCPVAVGTSAATVGFHRAVDELPSLPPNSNPMSSEFTQELSPLLRNT